MNGTGKETKKDKTTAKAIYRLIFIYVIISFLSGKPGILFSLISGLPFLMPAVAGKSSGTKESTANSILFGACGIIVSITFMLATQSYALKYWLVPAIICFGLFLCCIAAKKYLSARKHIAVKCISLVMSFGMCFLLAK